MSTIPSRPRRPADKAAQLGLATVGGGAAGKNLAEGPQQAFHASGLILEQEPTYAPFLVIALLFAGAMAAAAAASASDRPAGMRWQGIWMDSQNVLWIVAGPTEMVAVAGAAYHKLGAESYLDSLITFTATPSGDKLLLAAAEANGCSIEMSLTDGTIAAQEVNACSTPGISFDGTCSRQ